MDEQVQGPGRSPGFWRAAATPRMIALLVLLLAVAAVCGRLGVWQLDRATERAEQTAAARGAEQSAAPPTPLADLLEPQQSFPGELVARKVEVTGAFDGRTLLVPGRALEGRSGWLVLDAFRTEAGATLPVVRGWVGQPQASPPPSGDVALVGFLQAGEAAEPGDLPEGQVGAVSAGQLANLWGGPVYTGYLVSAERLTDDVALLPPPTVPGGGLNLQNLAYALQWWIFGGFAVLVWARTVRDEARARSEEADEADAEDPVGASGGTAGARDGTGARVAGDAPAARG